jgi:hypothetical protein
MHTLTKIYALYAVAQLLLFTFVKATTIAASNFSKLFPMWMHS